MAWTNSDMKVSAWMRGLLGIIVPEETIQSTLASRDTDGNMKLSDIDQRTAELLKADLYVWQSTAPSTGQSVEDADGHWKHKEGGYFLTPKDKRAILEIANGIYSKYGEATVGSGSKLRLINL
jgi:hypothetical protein